MPDVTWRRSSFCMQDSCVEVAYLRDGRVAIRRRVRNAWSNEWANTMQMFTGAEWDAFTAGVKAGEFDPPEVTP